MKRRQINELQLNVKKERKATYYVLTERVVHHPCHRHFLGHRLPKESNQLAHSVSLAYDHITSHNSLDAIALEPPTSHLVSFGKWSSTQLLVLLTLFVVVVVVVFVFVVVPAVHLPIRSHTFRSLLFKIEKKIF